MLPGTCQIFKNKHKSPVGQGQKARVGCSAVPQRLWASFASTSVPANSPPYSLTSLIDESVGELLGKTEAKERSGGKRFACLKGYTESWSFESSTNSKGFWEAITPRPSWLFKQSFLEVYGGGSSPKKLAGVSECANLHEINGLPRHADVKWGTEAACAG